jgi:hypothetical protein
MKVLKPQKRQATTRQSKKSWWMRRETFDIAILVMKVIERIAKLIDYLLR